MQIVPMPGKLLVKRLSPPTHSEFGIILPNTEPINEALQRGVVLAVGGPKQTVPRIEHGQCYGIGYEETVVDTWDRPDIRRGDVVVFPYRAGEEFIDDGIRVLLMPESDIRAIEEQASCL